MKKPSQRAGAVERFSFFFSENRPVPAPKPYFLTYLGNDIPEIEDVGLFQRGTRAEVSAKVAEQYRQDPAWSVEKRVFRRESEDD
ncbi:MAG: hypothetical protein ACYS22_09740 [Planctomycetota bacterium]|jgi:hypothetical protein